MRTLNLQSRYIRLAASARHLISNHFEKGKVMLRFTLAMVFVLTLGFVDSADATTLTSTALQKVDLQGGAGTGGIWDLGSTTVAPGPIGGVTTTLLSQPALGSNNYNGTGVYTFQAVDAANGMDITYQVSLTSHRLDGSNGNSLELEQTRAQAGAMRVISDGNSDRDSTTLLARGDGSTDTELIRVIIGNVVNSGTTEYAVDGITSLRFTEVDGIRIDDGGVGGSVIGSSSSGAANEIVGFSSASTNFDIVATTLGNINNSNRMLGFTAEFTSVAAPTPEPSSILLVGMALASLATFRRRRQR